jgi:hypothetical protein
VTVYIPTVGRPDNIRKIIPAWLDQDIPIRLVVERKEVAPYLEMIRRNRWMNDVLVAPLPGAIEGMGMGAVRRYIVKRAHSRGLRAIIMADDDAMPQGDNYRELLAEARKPDVLGIGAVRPIHDRFTGGAVSRLSGPILCPGGWGFILYGLNVANAVAVGNYNYRLHTACEDTELARQGIARKIPWRVHTDVWWNALGSRYSPGGYSTKFTSREERTHAEDECYALCYQLWPDYVNPPGKRLRMSWQKMLNDYIPDWRERSAIHGGSL